MIYAAILMQVAVLSYWRALEVEAMRVKFPGLTKIPRL